jgi:hypothetical protein
MNFTPNFPNKLFQNNPDPINQSSTVDSAYMQVYAFPATEKQASFVQSAHFGEPQNPYSPLGRQYAQQYDITTEDVSSLDDISSDPSWRTKSRYAPGKGKSKARSKTSNNGRGKKNASNLHWDDACTVIPKFGAQPDIVLFAIGDLMAPHLLYAVKHTRKFEKRNLNPGQRIKMIEIAQVRMRIP